MMNDASASAWRKYDAAIERLMAICGSLKDADATAETLSKIKIAPTSEMSRGVETVARAIGEMIKADLPMLVAGVIVNAQDDVREAHAALLSALDRDLKSQYMVKK